MNHNRITIPKEFNLTPKIQREKMEEILKKELQNNKQESKLDKKCTVEAQSTPEFKTEAIQHELPVNMISYY
jgi:hypothetical protein